MQSEQISKNRSYRRSIASAEAAAAAQRNFVNSTRKLAIAHHECQIKAFGGRAERVLNLSRATDVEFAAARGVRL